jgi:adenosylcobinamide-GDP ribazoletransferase
MRPFLSALAFLTTIPVRTESLTTEDFTRANPWFAWVGLCLGAIMVLADVGLRWLFPQGVATVLLVTLWILLTGGLHWDGFLDSCDALFASVSPTRRLEILKDVHIGAYGFIGGGLLLLTYTATLYELPPAHRGITLLVAPIAGRWLMTIAQQRFLYLRSNGLGQLVPPQPLTLLWGFIPLVALSCLGGWEFGVRIIVALLIAYGVAGWMARQLGGGLTGDGYGALCEITQVLVLVACCVG